MRAKRRTNPIGLSFLDAMTCGLGAVVLLYMVINGSVQQHTEELTRDLQAEVDRLEIEVLEDHSRMVELRNSVREVEDERLRASGLSRRLIESLEEIQVELATFDGSTIARREHINRLMADVRSLEEDAKRLSAATPSDETPGSRIRTHVGDGDRQYLTGLKVGGDRILFVVDASASMLDDTIVNIIRRRNLPDTEKLRSAKWRQAVDTVDWLTTQIPRTSSFQIYTFSDKPRAVLPDTAGRWLDGGDREVLERSMAALRQVVPDGGTNLHAALTLITGMSPRPDNVTLLVDGLPTMGAGNPARGTVSANQRAKLFARAIKSLPRSIPINIVLFPMEGDPQAASAYWQLAMAHRGSFMSLSEDWP
jgi:von Willebrand factor type A domain